MEALSKALDFAGKYAWAVCITTTFVLFIPEDVAKQIGVSELRVVFKGPIWIVLVLTFVLALGSAFQYIDRRLLEGWLKERSEARLREAEQLREAQRKAEEERQEQKKRSENERRVFDALVLRLGSLDPNEKMWVKYCLYHDVQTLSAERGNHTAQSLCHKGIVAEGSGHVLDLPFHIPDHVWKYLLEHKDEFLPEAERTDRRFSGLLDSYRKSLWAIY